MTNFSGVSYLLTHPMFDLVPDGGEEPEARRGERGGCAPCPWGEVCLHPCRWAHLAHPGGLWEGGNPHRGHPAWSHGRLCCWRCSQTLRCFRCQLFRDILASLKVLFGLMFEEMTIASWGINLFLSVSLSFFPCLQGVWVWQQWLPAPGSPTPWQLWRMLKWRNLLCYWWEAPLGHCYRWRAPLSCFHCAHNVNAIIRYTLYSPL